MAERTAGQRLYLWGGGLIYALPVLAGGAVFLATAAEVEPGMDLAVVAGVGVVFLAAVALLVLGSRRRGPEEPVGGKVTLGLSMVPVLAFVALALAAMVVDASSNNHPHAIPAVVAAALVSPVALVPWLIGLVVWLVRAVFRPPAAVTPGADPGPDGAE